MLYNCSAQKNERLKRHISCETDNALIMCQESSVLNRVSLFRLCLSVSNAMCEGLIRQYCVHDWGKYGCLDMVDSTLLYIERFMLHLNTF